MTNGSPEENKRSKWEYGILAVSISFLVVLVLAIPWSYYYKTVLYWEDGPGIALILAMLAILNCLSLIFRLRVIDDNKVKLNDVDDYHVTMAASTLANIFFWLGIAMWFVYRDLHISRLACFAVTVIGAGGHTILHFLRWRINKSTSTILILAVYSTILAGLTFAYFTGADFN